MNVARTGLSASALKNRLMYWVNPDWLNFALSHIDPLLSLTRIKAAVVAIQSETADTKSFYLQPNGLWTGNTAGQHIPVRIRIGGVIQERYYSLTNPVGAPRISITVKRQPGGVLSNWMNDHLRVGDLIEIGAPVGELQLPAENDSKLLLVAGGSGITPLFSLLQAYLARNPNADVCLLYFVRTANDVILEKPLRQLSEQHAGFNLQVLATDGEDPSCSPNLFTESNLRRWVEDFESRFAFTCGPEGLMTAVETIFQQKGLASRLQLERFTTKLSVSDALEPQALTFRRANLTRTSQEPTLLLAAEAAGLRPASGCRMGICNTCSCRKESGVVRNLVTGEIDQAAGVQIRLCVSQPLSPVVLDL